MKKRILVLKITGIIIVLFLVGILIPKITYHDSKNLSADDIYCGHYASQMYFESTYEPLFILKTATTQKTGNRIFSETYTLFGIPYATVIADNCKKVVEGGWDVETSVVRH